MLSKLIYLVPVLLFSLYSTGQVYIEIKNGKAYIVDTPSSSRNEIVKFVTKEMAISADQEVRIIADRKNVEIRTWDADKIKIVAGIQIADSGTITDDKLWEKSGIVISKTKYDITITSKELNSLENQPLFLSLGPDSLLIKDKNSALQKIVTGSKRTNADPAEIKSINERIANLANGSKRLNPEYNLSSLNYSINHPTQYKNMSNRPEIIIYIPKNKSTKIRIGYGSIKISSPLSNIHLSLTNSSAYGNRIDTLYLESKYSKSDFENIESASLDIKNSSLNAKTCNSVNITSSYSTFDADSIRNMNIQKSMDDVFDFDKVQTITGQKEFGDLKINYLFGKLDLDGISADIRIRNIDPLCTAITINNKLANVRLDLQSKNRYLLKFSGNYSTLLGLSAAKTYTETESRLPEIDQPGNTFTARGDDISTKPTAIDIKCDNCQANFR